MPTPPSTTAIAEYADVSAYLAAHQEESELGWRRSTRGNLWVRIYGGDEEVTITVFERRGRWMACLHDGKRPQYFSLSVPSEGEAIAVVEQSVEEMSHGR